ncbi:multivesicular body subunit 12B [Aethina tumida]|uniref:multivesicular body subunit 12B n=1 Tax=Aethina tumida TaxID=116153 RepID=UPI00096ADAC2|nr:multivesicular body subunit 12B [Aethina tumida]XP_019869964.1 multivesicular body subunit 12B [Aethina tumida]
MLRPSIQNSILQKLPDDRPITSIAIIENLDKCPRGFQPISKTHDQDQVADLRESSIFKSSSARYLCFSKTEGIPNFVIEDLRIITEKNKPPQGFSVLNRTTDSEQKPWRKKQLCFKLVNRKSIKSAVTDIIVCNRLKVAPLEFKLAGELNGILICYKMGNVQDGHSNGDANTPPERPPRSGVPASNNPVYPSLAGDSDHDYEILMPPSGPTRPAPLPPAPAPPHLTHQGSVSNCHTLGGATNGLEGVPFVINPRFSVASQKDKPQYPVIRAKTMQQILKEYDYPFTVERSLI